MLQTEQMELGFKAPITCATKSARHRRQQRAQWWFTQMRRAVKCAMEWEPSPAIRPEQVTFSSRG
ncbi:MAG: hypothetical protein ABJC04_04720 [Verrucomicrobiota bacterium]